MTVEEEDEVRGGAEDDIRSLFYWSRSAFYVLVAAAGLWVALGLYNLFSGLIWVERDAQTGSTAASSDIAWGIAYLAAAVLTFLLARWMRDDIVTVFGSRRFQVPRERLLVYSILALPFGFVIGGVLLVLVNVKLSHPEFMPSHAEAYPEGMPGWVLAVPTGKEEADEAVVELEGLAEEEVAPDEDALMEAPETDLPPLAFEPQPSPPPVFPAAALAPAPAPEPAPGNAVPQPIAAVHEDVPVAAVVQPVEEEIPEVMAVAAEPLPGTPQPPGAAPPTPAVVEAVVEEVPPEDGGDFILEPIAEGTEEFTAIVEEVPPEEDEEKPRDTKEAHEELMSKLLGR